MDVIYGTSPPKINAICAELTRNWAGVPAGEHLPLRDYMMALAIRVAIQKKKKLLYVYLEKKTT